MSSDGTLAVCGCCLLVFVIFAAFTMTSSDSDSSSSDIEINNTIPEEETDPLLNKTNITIKPTKTTFVYYDHNSSKFEGCYGLNYSVLTDKEGNKYMLDHSETDILANHTDYKFKFTDGIEIVYDNNTDTDIYKNLGCYYVHELRDANGSVIKSLGNNTLNDKSHEPDIIPSGWNFVYEDHNSSKYEGDEGLKYAQTNNTIGNKEKDVRFVWEKDVIGLAYNSPTFNYKYGLSGVKITDIDRNGEKYYTAVSTNLRYPNGTGIKVFDIKSHGLTQKEKNFITNYDNRIDEVRHQESIDAMYGAEEELYTDYIRHEKSKSHFSYYWGTGGSGFIYTP